MQEATHRQSGANIEAKNRIPWGWVVGTAVGLEAARRKAGTRAVQMALWSWFVLFIIDVPLIFFSEPRLYDWMMVAIAHSTRFLAAYLGGRAALKHAS